MEKDAKIQLYQEETNWLNRGRVTLLSELLKSVENVNGPVLDIGAGSGHAVATLRNYGDVDVIELAPEAQDYLKKKPIRTIYTQGLPDAEVEESYGTIVGLEVLEHIEDDKAAADWIDSHLKPDGVLLLTVPAYQWLFGPHDVANQHFRRYTRSRLLKVLPSGFEVLKAGYFITSLFPLAVLARFIWEVKSKIKRRAAGEGQQKQSSDVGGFLDTLFYTLLSVEAKLAGFGIPMPFGLTVYVLAKKSGARP